MPQKYAYQIRPIYVGIILIAASISLFVLVKLTFNYTQVEGTPSINWAVVLCVACLLFVSGIFAAFLVSFMLNNLGKRCIILTEEAITTPKDGLRLKKVTIPYQQLKSVQKLTRPQSSILIKYEGGWLTIPEFMLPNKADFEQIYQNLQSKLP